MKAGVLISTGVTLMLLGLLFVALWNMGAQTLLIAWPVGILGAVLATSGVIIDVRKQ